MPKKPGKRKNSTSGKGNPSLEKEFLKQLKRIEKDEAKTQSKRPIEKPKRGKRPKAIRTDRSGRTNLPTKAKQVSKVEVPLPAKQVRPGTGKRSQGITKRSVGSVEISRTKKTDQKIHVTFKGVRSVENKIRLLNGQDVDQVLKQQFKRKGGEPPLGLVVTVTDKDGNVASDVAPFDMVINKKNSIDFAERFLNALKSGNERFKDRNKKQPKKTKRSKQDKDGGLTDLFEKGNTGYFEGSGYDAYHVAGIQSITFKFIYAKS